MKFSVLCLSLVLASACSAVQPTPIPDTIASVKIVNVTATGATIQITNNADKAITAYTVAIEEIYQGGQVNRHERMADAGINIPAVIQAGHTVEEPDAFPNLPKNPVVDIKARLLAVVFDDQTAYVANNAAFDRIVSHRMKSADANRQVANILKKALDWNGPHPSQDALAQMNQFLATGGSGARPSTEFLSAMDDLKRVPGDSERLHVTERDYVKQIQQRVNNDAIKFAEKAEIRRVNQ